MWMLGVPRPVGKGGGANSWQNACYESNQVAARMACAQRANMRHCDRTTPKYLILLTSCECILWGKYEGNACSSAHDDAPE